jgi:tetratricopeptide (TPR) repeat protein
LALSSLGVAYGRAGRTAEARQVLQRLVDMAKQHYVSAYEIAEVYEALNDTDQAFAYLETAFRERSRGLAMSLVEPKLDRLRDDARFQDLMRRMKLRAF